jgi:hypothetical protein
MPEDHTRTRVHSGARGTMFAQVVTVGQSPGAACGRQAGATAGEGSLRGRHATNARMVSAAAARM